MKDVLCFLGLHPEWRWNVYEDTANSFEYCPNCHKERKPKS